MTSRPTFGSRVVALLVAFMMGLIKGPLHLVNAGIRWVVTEDLQTFDTRDASPVLSLATPAVTIHVLVAKSDAVPRNEIGAVLQQGVRLEPFTFLAPLLLCVSSFRLLSTDRWSVAHQYPYSRRPCPAQEPLRPT